MSGADATGRATPGTTDLLDVEGLRVRLRTHDATVHPVQGVNLRVRRGETLAVVGESGCGKSVSMLALLGLLPPRLAEVVADRAVLHGRDGAVELTDAAAVRRARVRGREIGYVAQDPAGSLDPTTAIGRQISDVVGHHLGLSRRAARRRAVELLGEVGLPDPAARVDSYPHELSGGMRQRVLIALAISCEPSLLVADEPTTALDVTVQAQIVELVRDLRDRLGLSVVWITHDLGVVAELADRVAVMYAGRIVEDAPVDELFADPLHPYSLGLLGAVPRLGRRRDRLTTIAGSPPELQREATNCSFAPRCPDVTDRCRTVVPALVRPEPQRTVACWVDLRSGTGWT
jgi:oligopeptide/dipeptide ABC transporter ATP-binding protein